MAKKSNFDMDLGLDMTSMTNIVTQVSKAADPTPITDTEEEPVEISNDVELDITNLDKILKVREKKVNKWCPITIAEEHLAIVNALKKHSKVEISVRDVLYNIVESVLSQHNDKIKEIVKKVEKAEIKKIQERLKNYA